MMDKIDIILDINGGAYEVSVEPRRTLADVIRDDCGLTGTHLGCEHGVCGACTVLVDGAPVRSCLMFAVQANGKTIRTVEGLQQGGALHPLAGGFHRASRPAMRLLHAGLSDVGHGAARAEAAYR